MINKKDKIVLLGHVLGQIGTEKYQDIISEVAKKVLADYFVKVIKTPEKITIVFKGEETTNASFGERATKLVSHGIIDKLMSDYAHSILINMNNGKVYTDEEKEKLIHLMTHASTAYLKNKKLFETVYYM